MFTNLIFNVHVLKKLALNNQTMIDMPKKQIQPNQIKIILIINILRLNDYSS